jgi:hypothetical protein
MEDKIYQHRLLEQIGAIRNSQLGAERKRDLFDRIDKESADYMRNAEKRCRKIKSGKIPFSPEAAAWIRRLQVYCALLRNVRGTGGNKGNLRRLAIRAGITTPFLLSEEDIQARMQVCRQHCKYYWSNGREYRRRHLNNCLESARERGDEMAEHQLLGIIKREKERLFWRKLKHTMGKKSGGSVQAVQVEDTEGNIEVFHTQADIHEAIWSNIHRKRFYLAEEAPICNSPLREAFGYNADTEAGEEVLSGTYEFEQGFDDATRRICQEVAAIRAVVPEDSVDAIVRKEDWSNYWSKAREETSSSESGLHFSHYKAGAESKVISHFQALKASVMLKAGWGYTRWGRGMSVMLEKIPGCQRIDKLRSILLMEADFNCVNKIVFGSRMLANVRQHGLMPDEIFSKRNRTAGEGTLSKVLFYDVV